MNPIEMTVVAIAIGALLTIITLVVLFAVFHRRIDELYNALGNSVHDVEKAIAGQSEKIAVIHHVATTSAAPGAAASGASKN
jgi:hypothetical protein